MSFQHTVTEQEGVQCFALEGRLDSATAGGLEKALAAPLEAAGVRVLLDLAQLSYVSSAGLRVILMAAKRVRQAQGVLVLSGLQPHVREVFEISGFLKILTVVDSRDQAAPLLAA